jgi:hypothetical protein
MAAVLAPVKSVLQADLRSVGRRLAERVASHVTPLLQLQRPEGDRCT